MQTAAERVRQKDAPDWSIRGGMKRGASPRTGSSGVSPVPRTGASEATERIQKKKGRPGLEHPVRREAGHQLQDWTVRG